MMASPRFLVVAQGSPSQESAEQIEAKEGDCGIHRLSDIKACLKPKLTMFGFGLALLVGLVLFKPMPSKLAPMADGGFQNKREGAVYCSSFTCPDGYRQLAAAGNLTGHIPLDCCEEALCRCTGHSKFTCSFTVHDSGCGAGYRCTRDPTEEWRYFVDRFSACRRPRRFAPNNAPVHTYYMYRTASKRNESVFDGINAANSVGEVVRILYEVFSWYAPNAHILRRLKVQFRPTIALSVRNMTFGPWMEYNDGLCGGPTWPYWVYGEYNITPEDWCGPSIQKYGPVVGCGQSMYMEDWGYNADLMAKSFWYSLPGPCHSRRYWLRNQACMTENPFGRCTGLPTGEEDCVFSVEDAGEIELCNLCGVEDCSAFYANGGVDYKHDTDRGINCSFWDGSRDAKAVLQKAKALEQFFTNKFGSEDTEELLCDYRFHSQDYCPQAFQLDRVGGTKWANYYGC